MFAAIILRGSRADPRDYATGDTLLSALTPFDQADVSGVWHDETALIVQALTWNTPESRFQTTPEICPDTGRVIAAWVRLDNRSDLCAALGLKERPDLTDPQIILAAHRAWGADCSDRLEGDFSFVIYDPNKREAFCARDTFGARPLFYCLRDDVFIASTTFAVFVGNPVLKFAPTVRWAAARLQFFSESNLSTPYDEVTKLAPAHHVTVRQNAVAGPVEFFAFDSDSPKADRLNDEWLSSYRERFFEAVDCRLRSEYVVASESSGGLDSSGIVARAADKVWHGRERLQCFGFAEMSEEHAWVLRTAYHCRIPNSHVHVRPTLEHPQDTALRLQKVVGYPPENDIPYATAPFYEGCQLYGARSLLSGFGGDEFVTGKGSDFLGELLRNRQFGAFLRQFDVRNARHQASALLRYATGRPDNPIGAWIRSLEIFQTCLLRDAYTLFPGSNPYSRLNDAMRNAPSIGARQLLHPIHSFGTAIRLEECSLVANSFGVDMSWPLLDRRLVAQYLRTPTIEKRRRSMGRYLHRRAIAGTVPDEITWKRTKTLGRAAQWSLDRTNPCPRSWEDLPPIFQEVVDPQKLAAAQKAVTENYAKDQEAMHRIRRRALQTLDLASDWVDTRE